MRHKLIDLLLVFSGVVIVLLAFLLLMGARPVGEAEAAASEPVISPCPDVALAVPEPTPAPDPTPTPEPDKPIYDPDVPLSEDLQYILLAACEGSGVEPAIALGLIEVESRFNVNADNGLCYGLMQLNRRYFPSNLSPGENIIYGVEYLGRLLARYGAVEAALTAYNAGHDTGNRVYANAVLAAAEKWRNANG